MASSQVPGGATGGQNHHLNVTAGQTDIFNIFPALPLELQELVWGEGVAFQMSPRVLCFTLELTWTHESGQ